VPFSDYAFNKAHTAAYGLISYWTGYLKANHPAEYMAALLTSVRGDKDKSALYLAECRRMGITVLPPDVNSSLGTFAAVGDDIRFGLAAVRNVGQHVVDAIVQARATQSSFTCFEDFLRKAPAVVCNKRTIESLIKAGAFDSLGHPRKGLVAIHEVYVDSVLDDKRAEAIGQDSLFAGLGDDGPTLSLATLPPVPDTGWDKDVTLSFEREMLGLYVSDHPLLGLEHVLARHADLPISALLADDERPEGCRLKLAGMVTSVTRKLTKQGKMWAIATVEDLDGGIEVLFFPKVYEAISTELREDLVCVVKGRLSRRDEVPSLHGDELLLPDLTTSRAGALTIAIPEVRCTTSLVTLVREVLGTHPGIAPVRVKVARRDGTSVLRTVDESLRVAPSPALFADLKALLGPSCLT
jgi:DNA polymerase-3 subunit alpha